MSVRASLVGLGVVALVGLGVSAACSPGESQANVQVQPADGRSLTAFASDDELRDFLRRAAQSRSSHLDVYDVEAPAPEETAPPPMVAPSTPSPSAQADASQSRSTPSITNTQEANVDEGGIVKTYRDMLVILRRGKLFTVSLANGGMRPVDSIDAFPPDVSGQGDWYDEMLVAGDRVIVIGYSYARGGTEVNRFRITPEGRLRFEDAYHLRSNDYYSSRNYASRLIGNRLIFYTPLYLGARGSDDPLDALPGVRKWGADASTRAFNRIAQARNVYIAPRLREVPDSGLEALHSVITCDLAAAELDCDATAVIGPDSRSFYVSGNAVYLFVSPWSGRGGGDTRQEPPSYIYRLPFAKDEKPTAIAARGAPVDQFSFREDPSGRLDVLVRGEGGDAMFLPEMSEGRPALLQIPLERFGDGSEEADKSLYRVLPALTGSSYDFHNRFVGNYLIYGVGSGSRHDAQTRPSVFLAPVDRPSVEELAIPHGVDRIEAMGTDAVVIGSGGRDLFFSAVTLPGARPSLGARYVLAGAQEGETRSHGFFFRHDGDIADSTGIIGLPIAKPVAAEDRRFFGSAAAMTFLSHGSTGFRPLGELDARPGEAAEDGCTASCSDWYGNARPIFLRGRVFALLGYELVEGAISGGRIGEVRRVSFAPAGRGARRLE